MKKLLFVLSLLAIAGLLVAFAPTVLTVRQGGTGASTLTAHYTLIGNGTAAVGLANPSTSGFVLTSNGASSDPTYQAVGAAGLASQFKIRTCEVVVGDPGAGSTALADDNDSPVVCGNKTGATMTITAVECYANAGSPTVTPIITGGGSTSILSGALTCGTGSFASGSLNGTPTETDGQSIDANITTAGGTAKYIVIRITRTL